MFRLIATTIMGRVMVAGADFINLAFRNGKGVFS